MKRVFIMIGLCIGLAACSSNSGTTTTADSSATAAPVAKTKSHAEELMASSDCNACHKTDMKLVGPSFKDIAKKYTADEATVTLLSQKIIKGGKGVWGDAQMTPHPSLAEADVKEMVTFILAQK